MTRRLLALTASILLFAAACGDDSFPVATEGGIGETTTSTTIGAANTPQARLTAARAQWAQSEPPSYRISIRQLCFCPETIWIDTITNGEIVSHEAGSAEGFYDPGSRSMEDLFDEVQAAIDEGFASLEVNFDGETGALVHYWVDVSELMADEEHGVDVEMLIDTAPGSPVDINAAALTDSYGCGYLFTAGNADQTLRLIIEWAGDLAPDLTSPVSLPSDQWRGRVDIGRDLFANWCDDVVELGEPEPVVTDSWAVAAGEMTITPADAGVDCNGDSIAASLTGIVIESADGEKVEFGQIELVNTAFGCFAG